MNLHKQETHLKEWQHQEESAEQMLPLIGHLYRNNNIVTMVYGRSLVNSSTIDILKAHRFARLVLDSELSTCDSLPILAAIARLDLAPARIDLGRLTTRYQAEKAAISVYDFIRRELTDINTGRSTLLNDPRDIVLYGFGRSGRLLDRIL